ncbi:hypothetical protein [Halochromatium salexigens]|uniref:hypothetical protein n=1 Tax=Halochromatium salexigens TaxID=49447 RepID=UPI0019116EB2|nr:hypothetical protein [Halochromatium salexigens]MCF7979366.1 hypothetical protein [Chromatiaceae bacterium]MCF8017664.1 hypothetical protein [Chromatiaceae bacterium]
MQKQMHRTDSASTRSQSQVDNDRLIKADDVRRLGGGISDMTLWCWIRQGINLFPCPADPALRSKERLPTKIGRAFSARANPDGLDLRYGKSDRPWQRAPGQDHPLVFVRAKSSI